MRDLDRLDWNLVPALNALLSNRNVSRAARRLGVSQSAASGALARLRRFFDDELLVRQGHVYELTPLAERLLPLASSAVASTRCLVGSMSSFDPSTSTRQFTVLMSDYAQHMIGPALSRRMAREAPSGELLLETPAAATAEAEELHLPVGDPKRLLTDVDGWLAPLEAVRGLPATGKFEDRWTCVVSEHHPTIGDELTRDDLISGRWVAFTIPGLGRLPRLRPLLVQGIEPDIELTVDSFGAIPFVVSGTPRIGLVQERLARLLSDAAGVRVLEAPVPMPPLVLTMWWHPDLAGDPGHEWFRGIVDLALRDAASGKRT